MTTASNFRDTLRMWFGGMILGFGITIAAFGVVIAMFPWSIAPLIVGILVAREGAKLFHKGCYGY